MISNPHGLIFVKLDPQRLKYISFKSEFSCFTGADVCFIDGTDVGDGVRSLCMSKQSIDAESPEGVDGVSGVPIMWDDKVRGKIGRNEVKVFPVASFTSVVFWHGTGLSGANSCDIRDSASSLDLPRARLNPSKIGTIQLHRVSVKRKRTCLFLHWF